MPVRRSSNCIPSSPRQDIMKPGIVTILGADCDRNEKAGSIRKTLSADMSSKKWLEQNGFFSPIKKVVSSQEIAADPDHQQMDDVWRSIQKNNEMHKPPQTQTGVWGSILTQKSDDSLLPPPPPPAPYVLPSVKRSTSSLSEKSLEICTESLGSETGSDCFSGYLAGEGLNDGDKEREDMQSEGEQERGEDPFADLHVVKYKNSPVRPLPPPLPSVGGDGASLRMQSHRENGRLVLEAVYVAPRNYFQAQRHDGRLVLTSMHGPKNLEDKAASSGDVEETVDYDGGDEEGESGGDEPEFVVEENISLPTGMISVHKSGLVMKKFMTLGNISPKWSNKCDELPILQSLPPRPPVARLISSPEPPVATAASSFNAYEYFWRSKPMITPNKNKTNQDLVSYMRGCKEARRSLLWEPCCIATS